MMKYGHVAAHRRNGPRYSRFVVVIERARSFVEDKQSRTPQQPTCQCDTLPFASRQLQSAFAQRGIQSARHLLHKTSGRAPQRFAHLLKAGAWLRKKHVLAHRAGEK